MPISSATLFTAFQRKARTNYAELAVSAVSERMKPVGFRTAADGDETGDGDAIDIWLRSRMNIVAADTHDLGPHLLDLRQSVAIRLRLPGAAAGEVPGVEIEYQDLFAHMVG